MQLYELGKLIGSGSFGQVFSCRHREQEKFYVIKKLRMMQLQQKDKQNIENQLKILQRLRHPNIVSYKDSFTDKQGNLCIVMTYCQNGDMDAKIRSVKEKGKNFTQAQILDWLVQTALAIYYLHNQKILHRDLKTQNLFLKKQERVKLGDFGIAKMLDSTQDLASTVIGTPYYMAPQLFKYKSYSYKSDIWSFGIVLYQLCNLRRPFQAQSYQGLALKILKGSYPSISPTYSKQLRDLITSMLSLKPFNRPSIVQILNKNFIHKRLQKYINDMFNRNNISQDMDDIYLDTLRQQAQLLNVSINSQQQTLKKYPSSKDLQKKFTKNLLTKRNQQQQQYKYHQKRKSTFQRSSQSLQKNIKKKQDTTTTSSSYKALNIVQFTKDQKQAFIDHKKKDMMEKYDKKNNQDKNMRKSIYNKDNYDNKLKRFKLRQDYSMDQQQQIQQNYINQQIIRQDSDQDLGQTTMNFQQQYVPYKYNKTYYKISGQTQVLKHMCQTLGDDKYLRAYQAVSKGSNKAIMLEILGQQMIGYWHLIDQIMFNQKLLDTLRNQ